MHYSTERIGFLRIGVALALMQHFQLVLSPLYSILMLEERMSNTRVTVAHF
jgi:hypothetical protein